MWGLGIIHSVWVPCPGHLWFTCFSILSIPILILFIHSAFTIPDFLLKHTYRHRHRHTHTHSLYPVIITSSFSRELEPVAGRHWKPLIPALLWAPPGREGEGGSGRGKLLLQAGVALSWHFSPGSPEDRPCPTPNNAIRSIKLPSVSPFPGQCS